MVWSSSARNGTRYLATTGSRAPIRSGGFSPTAHLHLRRTDGFEHVADIMVGSFYDPELDEGCAFEELISFHGGLGGLADPPFILCTEPPADARGAAHRRRGRHDLLKRWRTILNDQTAEPPDRIRGPRP